MQDIQMVIRTCVSVRDSETLAFIMHACLMLGNALNAGTPRGGAHAFRLASLQRIADTRSSAGPISLLDYLVQVIMDQSPDVVPKLKAELPMLEQGAKLQLKVWNRHICRSAAPPGTATSVMSTS